MKVASEYFKEPLWPLFYLPEFRKLLKQNTRKYRKKFKISEALFFIRSLYQYEKIQEVVAYDFQRSNFITAWYPLQSQLVVVF